MHAVKAQLAAHPHHLEAVGKVVEFGDDQEAGLGQSPQQRVALIPEQGRAMQHEDAGIAVSSVTEVHPFDHAGGHHRIGADGLQWIAPRAHPRHRRPGPAYSPPG